jgi:hypothetical protein
MVVVVQAFLNGVDMARKSINPKLGVVEFEIGPDIHDVDIYEAFECWRSVWEENKEKSEPQLHKLAACKYFDHKPNQWSVTGASVFWNMVFSELEAEKKAERESSTLG